MKSLGRIFYIGCCVFGLLTVNAHSADLGTKPRPTVNAHSADLGTKPRPTESVRGYLVDTVCVKEEAAQLAQLGVKHTRKCLQMPACQESGYALLLPSHNNDVLRFDKRGNQLAAKLVNGRHAEGGWLLHATGKRNGEEFAVATLKIVSKSPVKPGKK